MELNRIKNIHSWIRWMLFTHSTRQEILNFRKKYLCIRSLKSITIQIYADFNLKSGAKRKLDIVKLLKYLKCF